MNLNNDCVVKNAKFKMVPPDGGWGYMIWIAAIIINTTTTMFLGCFNTLFSYILEDLDMGSTQLALLNGTSAMCVAIAGYFTGSLLKVMSLRKLALLASLLYNVGAFCAAFVASKLALFICLGLLQGTGFGIMFNLICTQLNEYFLEKRLLSYSLTQSVSGAAAMVAPSLVKYSLRFYGCRGTLILISGISLHTFVAVALMQPVSWHKKRVAIPGEHTDELKLLVGGKKTKNANPVTPIVTLKDLERSFDSRTSDKKVDVDKCTTNERDSCLW